MARLMAMNVKLSWGRGMDLGGYLGRKRSELPSFLFFPSPTYLQALGVILCLGTELEHTHAWGNFQSSLGRDERMALCQDLGMSERVGDRLEAE